MVYDLFTFNGNTFAILTTILKIFLKKSFFILHKALMETQRKEKSNECLGESAFTYSEFMA